MTSYAGTASASGWSWGATWTGGDDANEDEEDGEDYQVRIYIKQPAEGIVLTTCVLIGLRYGKRLLITTSRLLGWNV